MRRGERGREKERFWRGIVRRQRVSGMSVREFCRIEGLSEPSFYFWRRELPRRRRRSGGSERTRPAGAAGGRAPGAASSRSPRGAAAFVPVVVSDAAAAAVVEIVLSDLTIVRVPPGCDRRTLALVLAALADRRAAAPGGLAAAAPDAGGPPC